MTVFIFMKKKNIKYIVFILLLTAGSCGISDFGPDENESHIIKTDTMFVSPGQVNNNKDKFSNVKFTLPLDHGLAATGQSIFGAKCSPCHKLTGEDLIGPGLKGITERHTAEWIMNFITNTEVTVAKDYIVRSKGQICTARTPMKYISDMQARQIVEFMRMNDSPN